MAFLFVNAAEDPEAAHELIQSFYSANRLGRTEDLVRLLRGASELRSVANHYRDAAVFAFENIGPAELLGSPFTTTFGLLSLLAFIGELELDEFGLLHQGLLQPDDNLPMQRAISCLESFGRGEAMEALRLELEFLESARRQRTEAAQLALRLHLPVPGSMAFEVVIEIPHAMTLKLNPSKHDWRLWVHPSHGEAVSCGRDSLGNDQGIPRVNSLVDVPKWFAETYTAQGWKLSPSDVVLRIDQQPVAAAPLVDWLTRELAW